MSSDSKVEAIRVEKPCKRVVIGLISGTLFVVVLWLFVVNPIWILVKTKEKQMVDLSNSVVAFNTIYDRLPRSVDEMVRVGVLPFKSIIYFCPLAHDTLFLKELFYRQMEFEFVFHDDKVTVVIPPAVFAERKQDWRYKFWLPASCGLDVLSGTKFSDTGLTNHYMFK